MGAHDGFLSMFRACNPNIGVPRRFAKSRCGTPIFGLHALRGLSNCHLASPFQATLYRPCAPITFMLDANSSPPTKRRINPEWFMLPGLFGVLPPLVFLLTYLPSYIFPHVGALETIFLITFYVY